MYMLRNCRKSCQTCGITDEDELDALSAKKLELHEVGGDETLLETPYGITQSIGTDAREAVLKVIQNFTTYMENIIFKDPQYSTVRKTCKNRHADCAFWTHLGECEKVCQQLYLHCGLACVECGCFVYPPKDNYSHTCFFHVCFLTLGRVIFTPLCVDH